MGLVSPNKEGDIHIGILNIHFSSQQRDFKILRRLVLVGAFRIIRSFVSYLLRQILFFCFFDFYFYVVWVYGIVDSVRTKEQLQ